jgi:hypothetical protein
MRTDILRHVHRGIEKRKRRKRCQEPNKEKVPDTNGTAGDFGIIRRSIEVCGKSAEKFCSIFFLCGIRGVTKPARMVFPQRRDLSWMFFRTLTREGLCRLHYLLASTHYHFPFFVAR